MKTLAVVLSLWAFSVHAADECKSVWVYKPYKTCSDARNGLDLSKATPTGETKVLSTPALQGGPRAEAECDRIGKTLEIKMPDFGVLAERSSISDGKSTKDLLGNVTYVYQCSFRMMKAPFKTSGEACGVEDNYAYQSRGTNVALAANAHCLSCDSATKSRADLTSCLIKTQAILTEAGNSVPLRKEENQAILNRVNAILKLEKSMPQLSVDDQVKIVDLQEKLLKDVQAQ